MITEDGCNNVIFPVGTHLCVCPEWLWGPWAVQGPRRRRFRLLGYQQSGSSSQDPDSCWTAPWLWLYVALKFYITLTVGWRIFFLNLVIVRQIFWSPSSSIKILVEMWYLFNVHGSVHCGYILIYIQQDAKLHNLFISGNCSTCFRWYLHPSSGAHTTVSTASGTCQTVTATCRYRGRVGTAPR